MKTWILTAEITSLDTHKQTVSLRLTDGREQEIPRPDNVADDTRVGTLFEVSVPWGQADNEDLSTIEWLAFEPLGYDDLTDDELMARLAAGSLRSRHSELVDKKFLSGLTDIEANELDDINRLLDVVEAEYYEPIKRVLAEIEAR